MFQNIIDEELREDKSYDTENKKKVINLKNLFSVSDFVLYAISFMVSMVSFNGEFAPFGLAIFAAVCSNRIPLGIVYIATCIGTLIGFGANGFLSYLLTTLLFVLMTLMFRPRFEEDRNEKQKLGLYIFLSTFIVQTGKMFFTMFLVYDLLSSFVFGILTYIFYKIFANSITVIKEYGIKKAFTVEEVMGASLLLAIAFYSFNGLNVFGLSISNILSIMLVLFLGWKYGMLVGATAGITIGMVLGIIGSSSPVHIASYAISGMIAGILNKLGKIGVIVGFALGNAVLTYVVNGNTVPVITIREILIASLGLLLLPKNIDIDISDIVGKTKLLPTTGGQIEGDKETIYKLNTVSETISEMAKSYSEVAATTVETDEELKNDNKQSFKEEFLNNIEDFSDNILYEDIIYDDDYILDNVYNLLEEKEEITREELIKIFEDNNSYIIGINEEDERNKKIEKDINQIVKAINHTYRINNLNMIWKQKEANNKKVLANQLGGVSKVISSLADEIEDKEKNVGVDAHIDPQKQINFKIEIASRIATKNNSEVSGDSFVQTKLRDGKYMMAISDGMGSGPRAKKSSSTVIKMLKRLLTTGFDKDVSIGLINSSVNLNSTEETYATIDISVFNNTTGNIEFIKNGACPTFIKSGNNVEVVKAVSLPAGIVEDIDLVVYDKDLKGGEIVVMCSDGILESNSELTNKEIWVKELLENIETDDIQRIADILLQESIDNGLGIAKDDMTILIAKVEKIEK